MPAAQLSFPEIECGPVASRPVLALVAQSSDEGCTGNEKRKGRAPTHADSAARKAAYRAAKARVDYTDKPEIIAKLKETAAELDCSVNELLQSMVRFAECNRNWKHVGLYGARRDGALQ
ncbi:hypothetical protein [Delftia tsuruhatensis]|uniref:hypothetical protein n=1 Tax=Delftia tsuruhatensis TaxID=180282 RepID=UPI000AC9B002|nr:hypothetical protein [Delftia tsuruhatensis]